jgi:hypothetical protein
VEFSKELRDAVLSGDITVSFRLWQRPKVRPGGRYPVGPGQIEVDSVELMPFAAITPDDIRRCGERDGESLRQRAAHTGPIADDTLLYRVEFHLAGPPDAGRGQRDR